MNDLAICKRIAEIEGVDFLRKGELSDDLLQPDVLIVVTRRWDNGGLKGFMEYNPLTDDALWVNLILTHEISISFNFCLISMIRDKQYEMNFTDIPSLKRKSLLLIIEAHK